ncbi:transcription initiation factor IIA subunit 1-like [Watersipora subatra]|uniref:transcription initiation factor IIA subunit 1-like n=1 Tax=Watersipora subatra TaxID=2589382 RepID=UPI00355B313A
MATVSVDKLYKSVISEVIESMKEAVLEEGMDEQVLAELKMLWEQKLSATKATDAKPTPSHIPLHPASSTVVMHNKQTVLNTIGQRSVSAVHPSQAIQMSTTQVFRPAPVRPHQNHPLDMSGAASAATMALPQLYQQQLLTTPIQLQQTSTGLAAVIPSSAIQAGSISLQPVQQVQPQNLSTKVQGQLDGASDLAETGSEGADNQVYNDHSCRPKICNPRHRRRFREIEVVLQLDGADDVDTSSEEDDDLDDDDNDDLDNEGADGEDEEPLNSNDDDDEDDANGNLVELDNVDNVVVCQYDKITRSKNRWRFTLKDGIMHLNQRDYVFHKANGEAEW